MICGGPLFLIPSNGAEWRHWFENDAPRLIPIALGLFVAYVLFRFAIRRLLQTMITRATGLRRESPEAVQRRAKTLVSTLSWLFMVLLLFVGSVLVLDNLDVNVGALIAGVGIAGVAIGLGAQTLIRDIINGTFILVEGQYSVGDSVTVAGVSGEVLEINPRRTVLRDADGSVHTVPNSAIAVATNHTQGISRIVLDVPLGYGVNLEETLRVLRSAYHAFAAEFPSDGLSPAATVQVQTLGEHHFGVRLVADVRVGRQWELSAELRRCIVAELGNTIAGAGHEPSAATAPE
jgi:small conductance mechanosensitive channel